MIKPQAAAVAAQSGSSLWEEHGGTGRRPSWAPLPGRVHLSPGLIFLQLQKEGAGQVNTKASKANP